MKGLWIKDWRLFYSKKVFSGSGLYTGCVCIVNSEFKFCLKLRSVYAHLRGGGHY